MMGHPALEKEKQYLFHIFNCVSHEGLGDGPHSCSRLRCCLWNCALWTPRGRKAHLRTVFYVVSFVEAKVTQVVGRRPFAGSARLRGQGQVGEMVRQGAQAIYDVVKRPVRWGALEEIVVQRLMEKKKHQAKTHPAALMPSDVSKGWDSSFLPQILHFYAFNIYFNFRPHALFKKSEYTQRLETVLEAEKHVFLIIPKKKMCLKFQMWL